MKSVLCSLVAITCAFFSMAPGAFAQAPRTISHQGLLTDLAGDPLVNAVRSMTFKIYDVPAGGAALWTETKNVATVDGIFHTILGSDTPITGVRFGQPLWLGVAVAPDAEIVPRASLTSVPSAFGLVSPFLDTLRIQTGDWSTDGSERVNEDLTIYAWDAQIGLYSDAGGSVGSGIQLGEIISGELTDKWAMYRRTSGAGSELRFSHGTDPSYANNVTRVQFESDGTVTASKYEYPFTGRVHYRSINAEAFHPPGHHDSYEYYAANSGAYITGGANELSASFHLPDAAEIDSLFCYVYDDSALDLQCQITGSFVLGDDIGATSFGSAVSSSGTPGATRLAGDIAAPFMNNRDFSTTVTVRPVSGAWITEGANLQVKMVVIKYIVREVE